MCVCMYICMYVYERHMVITFRVHLTSSTLNAHIHTYMYTYVYTHIHTYIYTYVYIYIHTYIYIYTYIFIYINVYIYIYMYLHIYIYIHMYTCIYVDVRQMVITLRIHLQARSSSSTRVWMSHITYQSASCPTWEWVTSHIGMSQVSDMGWLRSVGSIKL